MKPLRPQSAGVLVALFACTAMVLPAGAGSPRHLEQAKEVMEHIQEHFWDRRSGLYMAKSGGNEPDMIWGSGVMFSAVLAASRHEKEYRSVTRKFFDAMDAYWDVKAEIPGYEPARTQGGNDKYYDDNAWMVLTFLEAYEQTRESRYLKRAEEVLEFVVSGWDEEAGGGIWWHEQHKGGGKNTCANAPAALGCFRLARFEKDAAAAKWNAQGEKITVWTVKTLQGENGLFWDNIEVATGKINKAQLTYNSALMLRCFLSLYSRTKEQFYLTEAMRIGKAAAGMAGSDGVYRDPIKWSHLMVEADLELWRHTGEAYLKERASKNGEAHYKAWKQSPPEDLISQASLARELWLLVDHETPAGREFWKKSDQAKAEK